MDDERSIPDETRFAICERQAYCFTTMLLLVLFVLGVANFAVHRAVLDSGHPMLDALPGFYRSAGGRISLAFEFLVLLVAMLLAGNGWPGAVTAYGVYSLLNLGTAWLVLSGRI